MSRIAAVFENRKGPAFIGFAVAGDPDLAGSIRIGKAILDAGADILELGVPFSDPVADGPVIQKADERSLASGTTPSTVFEIVRELRKGTERPIVLLAYYNTVHRQGIDRFYREAASAGADGILIADMPVEESEEVTDIATRYAIDQIFLIAPTTSDTRIRKIAARARGYLYLVAALGVTGVRDEISPVALDLLARVRGYTALPLALGFGISNPRHARTCAAAGADGIIVGSAIVSLIEENLADPAEMDRELAKFISSMKRATE